MDRDIRLIYISSRAILDFCAAHPIKWMTPGEANGPGNVLTPTPAIGLFYKYVAQTERMFTQEEYWNYANQEWGDWIDSLSQTVKDGLRARLYRNFYPSCVDTIYVWAMLAESGKFAYCVLDSIKDAVGKVDISVHALNGQSVNIALYNDSKRALNWTVYKRTYRGEVKDVIDVLLPMERAKGIGNKRWYEVSDFAHVYTALGIDYFQSTTPAQQYAATQTLQAPFQFANAAIEPPGWLR